MAAKPIFVQAVDTNGAPYSGAKLNVYDAGTTTPRAIYTESGLGTASANPAIANANGVVVVWVNDAGGDIKVTLTNSAETVTPHNEDNVPIASLTCYPVITFQGDQSLLTTSSPTFAGLTLGNVSFAGVVTDPNADRLVFWDDSAGQVNFMTLGAGLSFNGTALELDGDLADISGLTPADGAVIIGDGTDFVTESGSTLRASIGVAVGTDVLAYDSNLQAFVDAFAAPTADGTAGQYLKTDGAGTLSFATPAGGGDTLAAANETISGDWAFTGSPDFSGAGNVTTIRSGLGVETTGVADYTALKALAAGAYKAVIVGDSARGGLFDWVSGDQSAEITADPGEGAWVPPSSDVTGASGAWRRVVDAGIVLPEWFGAVADGSTDDTTALTRCFAWAATNKYRVDLGGEGKVFRAASSATIPSDAYIGGTAAIYSDHTGNGLSLASGAADVLLEDFELYSDASTVTITSATQANPVVITLSSGHGLVNGDRIKIPAAVSGMTELGGRGFELNNKSGDTFELREGVLGSGLTNVDGTGYTAWSGAQDCISYAAARTAHRAIFGQSATFNNGVNATYFNDIHIRNVRVHGYGADGVRIDFVKGLVVEGCDIYDCATHGILSLSPRHFDIARNKIHSIGPGDNENNAGYGVSVSRVKTYTDASLGAGTEASLADSPRPFDGRISGNRIYRIEDYAAIDTHSCDGVAITGNTIYEVALGYNFEHHSSAGVLASSENVTVSGNSFKGTTGAYNSVGPAIAIDTRSGGGELGKGVCIVGNNIERFGHRGNNPLFTSSGAIYARDTAGMVIVGNSFNTNYGRDIYLNTGNSSFTVVGNSSTNLQTGDSVRNMVDIKGTGSDGSVSNNRYENASGNAYNDDANGTIDLLEFNGNRVITKDRAATFTRMDSDNMRLDGNTLSATNTNGSINITPDGSGSTRISGLVNIGSGGAPGYELDVVDGSDTAFRIWATDNSAGADTFLRQLVTNTSASNYLYFGDGSDQDVGILQYRHSDDKFRITAGASLTLELDNADADFYTNVNVSTGHGFQVNGTQVVGAQESGTGETAGFTAGAGTAVNDDSTFTGNVGSTAYRISDIVRALKNHGLIAS